MILEIDNVALNYGNKSILYGIYLKATKGHVTGILGRNGSGKSSLLKIIFGSLKPKSKSLRINNKRIPGPLYRKGFIAFLPQHQLFPNSIKLKTIFKIYDQSFIEFKKIFHSFSEYQDVRINQLSTGERKVIEAYLVLNSSSKIILLDEPFSFVAPVYVELIEKLINTQKEHKIIILTDHYYENVINVSNQIILLKNGCSKMITNIKDLEDEGYLSNPQQKLLPK